MKANTGWGCPSGQWDSAPMKHWLQCPTQAIPQGMLPLTSYHFQSKQKSSWGRYSYDAPWGGRHGAWRDHTKHHGDKDLRSGRGQIWKPKSKAVPCSYPPYAATRPSYILLFKDRNPGLPASHRLTSTRSDMTGLQPSFSKLLVCTPEQSS